MFGLDSTVTTTPTNPLGAKGIGELPMDGGAPAVVQAIENATGLRVTEIPATPGSAGGLGPGVGDAVVAALARQGAGLAQLGSTLEPFARGAVHWESTKAKGIDPQSLQWLGTEAQSFRELAARGRVAVSRVRQDAWGRRPTLGRGCPSRRRGQRGSLSWLSPGFP